jgi:hypothetical protein
MNIERMRLAGVPAVLRAPALAPASMIASQDDSRGR